LLPKYGKSYNNGGSLFQTILVVLKQESCANFFVGHLFSCIHIQKITLCLVISQLNLTHGNSHCKWHLQPAFAENWIRLKHVVANSEKATGA